MKKFVYISWVAAPHVVKLCEALQKYFVAEGWFYDVIGTRAQWWQIPLGNNCKIIPNVYFKRRFRYFCFSHLKMLKTFQPDIVMVSGFSIPANYLAYLWARRNKKKIVVFTERSRKKDGTLRTYNWTWKILRFLYRNVDMVMVSFDDILPQFRDEFKFGDKVVISQYASLIDDYLDHPERDITKRLNFIFPNRLVDIYNPILAIDIFANVCNRHPQAHLFLNAIGDLRNQCEQQIFKLGLNNKVSFLDNIKKWDDLGEIYAQSDIMIFPALTSNGNFTIIEAMASGMGIVISNKILGTGNLITDHYNGFKRSPVKDDFIDAIDCLLQSPQLINEYAQINRKMVQPFSVNATAQLYSKLIEKLFISLT